MLINLRNALMTGKRLPYDAEVEYLQSSGAQYIDTGVVGASEWRITAQGAATPTTSNCVIATTSSGGSFWGNYATVDYWAVGNGSSWRCSLPYTSLGSFVVTFSASYVQFTVNGETVTRSSSPNFTKAFCLFSTNGDGYGATVRIYGCKVFQNSLLVRDYIPVRVGTVGYLYDRVTRRLFGNAGTGDFVLGPDVVPVEYIESHDREYIDTGVIPDNTTGIEVVHSICPNNGTDNIAFGMRQDSGDTRYWCDIDWGIFDAIGWGFNSYSGQYERFALADSDVGRIITNSLNFMNDRAGKIDGVTYDSSLQSNTLATMSRSIYLFGANNKGAIAFRLKCKMVSAKISHGQSIVRDYKPIRVGNEGAMMDVLTRRVYRNAGTGAFTYGNDLKYPIPSE